MLSCIFPNPYACKKALGGQKNNKKNWPENGLTPPLRAHCGECLITGIRRPEHANVLQLWGESRQPVFHFLTSSEIELEAEPRYLYARFLYTLSRLALLLAKSHLNEYCIVSNRLNSHYTQHYTATKQSQTRTWNPAIINIYSCLHFPLVMFPNFGFVIA